MIIARPTCFFQLFNPHSAHSADKPGKVARLRRSVDHERRDPRRRHRGRRRLPAALARVVQGRDHVEARACARGAARERRGRYLGRTHALRVW